MREVTKADGTKAITTEDEPKVRRLKEAEMITTANIEAVKRRTAELEADAAKAEGVK